MRGVPREREAISAVPSASASTPSRPGRTPDDRVELVGLVVLQLGGEAEPVAQRTGQQPGPGRGADQRERRDLQRDRRRARALADHDVDPEVLHREVEHLLGRARHPVDLVDEEDVAVVEPGQDGGQVAGVGDRRSAGEPQGRRHLGRDDHRERGLAESRWTGEQHVVGSAPPAPGGLEDQAELVAHPLLADHLVERARPQRRLDRALVALGLGRGQRGEVGLLVGRQGSDAVSSRAMSGPAQGAQRGTQRAAATSRRARRPGRRPTRSPCRRPWPTSRDRPGPAAPGRATARMAPARRRTGRRHRERRSGP